MTTTVVTGFRRAAAPVAPVSGIGARALIAMLLDRLDRMLPTRQPGHAGELPPPEWFKFPPI